MAERRPPKNSRPPPAQDAGPAAVEPRSTIPGMSALRWRPEDGAAAAAAGAGPGAGGPGAPVAGAPPEARIAQPIVEGEEPGADERTRADGRFGPDPASRAGEMAWRTQVGPAPGAPGPAPAVDNRRTDAIPSSLAPVPTGVRPVAGGPPPAAPSVVIDGRGGGTPPATTQVTVYKLERPVEFDKRLVMLREPDSPAAAAYRVLRHRLAERGHPRVIVVSSPRPREGKTTVAVNLALALGEAGRARVLLVEANLRSPRLAEVLAFMPPVCFSEQVATHRDQPDEPWTVVEAHSPWLHVAAVKPDQRDRPLIDGPAFAIAIDQLRHAGYDYVVIDTPAVLGAADVNLTQDSADGVLLVARARTTPGRYLRRAIEQLAPTKVLGVVMNDAG